MSDFRKVTLESGDTVYLDMDLVTEIYIPKRSKPAIAQLASGSGKYYTIGIDEAKRLMEPKRRMIYQK